MIILIDTSTPTCRVAVVDGETSTLHQWEAGRELARGLLGYLTELTGDLRRISGIGVMMGPGSFTGLRIGVTVANTLADSLSIPIVGQEMSDNWQQSALDRLKGGQSDRVVLPVYGGQANITQPRK